MNDLLPEPRLEGSYRLARGRRIGFAEWGRADGVPVLWFHGTPGGRHQIAPDARRLAADMGIRLISLERPGIGGSSRHLYENIAEWADDVGTIVDRLGIDRFACVGLSGGGPYVLACAARSSRSHVCGRSARWRCTDIGGPTPSAADSSDFLPRSRRRSQPCAGHWATPCTLPCEL